MKVRSLLGPKEIPHAGRTFLTDDDDVADVPDELGASLLEQVDAWAPVTDDTPPAEGAENEEG